MTSYDQYLEELKRVHNATANTAIRRLYELLKLEDPLMSKDDLYDRIVKDCLEIWQRQTILNNMIDELKDEERQESGRKGRKKQLLTVTNDGSVAHGSGTNNSPESPTESKSSYLQNHGPGNYEQEKQQLYEKSHNGHSVYYSTEDAKRDSRIEELQLENGRLKEQMKEQKEQIGELIKSVNAAALTKEDKKIPIPAKESIDYKALMSELEIIKQERDELKQVVSMQMKQNPSQTFQTAAHLDTSNSAGEVEAREIEFPSSLFGKFFIATRNVTKSLFLKLDKNGVVIGWDGKE